MKRKLHLSEAPHIENVAIRNLLTLMYVTNGGCNQSMKQPIDRRMEGTLLGQAGDIGLPNMGPNLNKVILLGRNTHTVVQKCIKMRTQSLFHSVNP